MDGSEKLPLLVIGKFGQPRCFKGIRTLPVTYRHNKKAWMTSTLFEEWVRKLDRRLLLEGRSVALVLDNCSAHPHVISDLRAITLFFLPPNTTSRLQPCDQGIIKNFKTIYRKQVLRKFISFDETGSTDAHLKMSLLDALVMSAASWHDVTDATVQNCFRHAGFVKARPTASNPEWGWDWGTASYGTTTNWCWYEWGLESVRDSHNCAMFILRCLSTNLST